MKTGLIILTPVELNVLQVALNHMHDHLCDIADEEDVTLRLEACENLLNTLK